MLQIIFDIKRFEISYIERKKNRTIVEQIVWAIFKDNDYSKICNILKTGYLIKEINLYHFFDL